MMTIMEVEGCIGTSGLYTQESWMTVVGHLLRLRFFFLIDKSPKFQFSIFSIYFLIKIFIFFFKYILTDIFFCQYSYQLFFVYFIKRTSERR